MFCSQKNRARPLTEPHSFHNTLCNNNEKNLYNTVVLERSRRFCCLFRFSANKLTSLRSNSSCSHLFLARTSDNLPIYSWLLLLSASTTEPQLEFSLFFFSAQVPRPLITSPSLHQSQLSFNRSEQGKAGLPCCLQALSETL